jgi:hypothetical protein
VIKKFVLIILFLVIIFFTLALFLLPSILDKNMNPVTEHAPYIVSDKAKKMHKSLIVGDWHADSALWNRDLKKTYDYGHVDIPRLQKGNVALQMFTTVTKSPAGQNYTKNSSDSRDNITALAIVQMWPIRTWFSLYERAIFQSNKIRSLAERDPNNFMLIESRIDLDNFLFKRKITQN